MTPAGTTMLMGGADPSVISPEVRGRSASGARDAPGRRSAALLLGPLQCRCMFRRAPEQAAASTDERPGFVARLRNRLNAANSWLTYDLTDLFQGARHRAWRARGPRRPPGGRARAGPSSAAGAVEGGGDDVGHNLLRKAELSTIIAFCPPVSAMKGMIGPGRSARVRLMARAVSVEPVKAMPAMRGSATRRAPTLGPSPGRRWSASTGMPAWWRDGRRAPRRAASARPAWR